jgi:hypothetical protein
MTAAGDTGGDLESGVEGGGRRLDGGRLRPASGPEHDQRMADSMRGVGVVKLLDLVQRGKLGGCRLHNCRFSRTQNALA